MRQLARILLPLACVALTSTAGAEIFSFVDREGVTHYTNVPADERYLLMLTDQRDGDNARPVDEVLLERAHRFNAYIQQAADTTGVESELLRAVIVVESAFDHQAISSAGAGGLMQLMPQTAARYGVTDVFDPQDNISGGARYLRDLIGLYKGNVELVLAAYNAGEAAVDRYGGKVPPYPETLAYVPRVLKVYSTLRMLDQII